MTNKLLGQNFLRNPMVIKKIITAIDVQKNDTIVEVGPGHGELTIPLAKICGDFGAKFIAIEKDEKLAEEIKNLKLEIDSKDFEIISGDALDFFSSNLLSHNSSFKIVGNIPYYLTGHLLRIVGELPEPPKLSVFMIQKEVAERLISQPPDMNRLAASIQFWAAPKILMSVPKKDFSPAPNVDSAVIVLQRKENLILADREKYFSAMRVLFAQPRKTILNNLVEKGENRRENKEEVSKALAKISINPSDRPQDLSVEQISEITRSFFST